MRIALRDLLIPQPKSKIKAGDGITQGVYKFFTSSPIQNRFYDEATYDQPSLIFGTGGNASVHYCAEPFSTSTDCLVMYGTNEANLELIYQYLHTNLHILQAGFKGAGLQHISKDYILDIKINMPDADMQNNIAKQMRKIDNMIDCRNLQLFKYDELVKSRFVELFGDPIRNTQNRPTTDFINVVMMQRGFDLPVQDRQQDGGVPVFGSNGALDRHNIAKVYGGGVITGRSGTIGKVYYTEGDYWPLNTSLFSVNTHGNNIIYLAYLLKMYDLSRFTEGTGVPTLNRNKFHNKPIIDVPLVEQEAFALFVKQVDKLKSVVQRSLEQLETLKKALMQQYFG